ncbi:hypothetical protein L0Y59_04060, partial [Candidatus Uhrbacteria bacterium]|nr:hypothetical protein [Candidatus Uhrbacteria bacterium]
MYARVVDPPYVAGGTIRNFHGWAKVCNEDSLGWISLNCADLNPTVCGIYPYRVPLDLSTAMFRDPTGVGSPMNGTSFAWNGNSDLSGFGYIDFSQAYMLIPGENTVARCTNTVDDDLDGATDCADTECAPLSPCFVPPIEETLCTDGTTDLCCSNAVDDDFDGPIDCEDTDCRGYASMCTVAWLKTQYGNVYAQKGIESIVAPAEQFNATYCLSVSDGSISGFASKIGCTSPSETLELPKQTSGYRGSLGAIDVAGIREGRYGQVITIADGNALPESLDGRVYRYIGGGTLTLPARMFRNGIGLTGRGNGLLLVDGANLHITGNSSYEASSLSSYLRNLA